jgi:hypothetical protein
VKFVLSPDAEQPLEQIEQQDPLLFRSVLDDLTMLESDGIDGAEFGTMFGQWVYLTGPTGRVSYWMSPYGDDLWMIESIDASPTWQSYSPPTRQT